MALMDDTKVKLAAGVYGDFVTNGEVDSSNPNVGYKPNLGNTTHESWIEDLLSGDDDKIKQALAKVDIANPGEQLKVIGTLPTNEDDRAIAMAIYKKLKKEILSHRPSDSEASSHDY